MVIVLHAPFNLTCATRAAPGGKNKYLSSTQNPEIQNLGSTAGYTPSLHALILYLPSGRRGRAEIECFLGGGAVVTETEKGLLG